MSCACPPHPAPTHRRRGALDAGDSGLEARFPGRNPHLSRRTRCGGGGRRQPRSRSDHRGRAHPRPARACSTTSKLAWQLRRDRYDVVIDMHGGPRSSWLTLATGAPAADRLRHARPAVDVHADRPARPRAPSAPLGPEPVGPARGHRGLARGRGRSRPRRGRHAGRSRRGSPHRRAPARSRRRARPPADRAPRQRQQPVPALAGTGVRGGGRQPGVAVARPARDPQLGSFRSPRGRSHRRRRARAAARRGAVAGDRLRRVRPRGAAGARGTKPAVRRRRHRTASRRRDDGHAGRRDLRPDAAGALGAVARPVDPERVDRDRRICRAARATSGSAHPAITGA